MRKGLLATASVLALGGAAAWRLRAGRRAAHGAIAAALPPPTASTSEITRRFILYFILPLWLAAGVADWLCHRAADIEGTTAAERVLLSRTRRLLAEAPPCPHLFPVDSVWFGLLSQLVIERRTGSPFLIRSLIRHAIPALRHVLLLGRNYVDRNRKVVQYPKRLRLHPAR